MTSALAHRLPGLNGRRATCDRLQDLDLVRPKPRHDVSLAFTLGSPVEIDRCSPLITEPPVMTA
jgi:hypothetical protein